MYLVRRLDNLEMEKFEELLSLESLIIAEYDPMML